MSKNKEIKNQIDDDFEYKKYSLNFDFSDYFNMFMAYKDDLVFIAKNAGKYIKIIVKLVKIFIKIKEFAMDKHKIFNIITTVLGVVVVVWQGIIPVISNAFTWDKLIMAILTAILGYFAKLNKKDE